MAVWSATKAKTQLDALLDKAELEGPQLVRRGNQVFYVMTIEDFENRVLPNMLSEALGIESRGL